MKNKLLTAGFLVLSLLVLGSCTGNLEDMIDNYNGNFKPVYTSEPETRSPGDKGFDQQYLLYDEYFVYDDASLILAAPENCSSYEWKFTDPENENADVTVIFRDTVNTQVYNVRGTVYTKRVLSVFVPESLLEVGKTYKLTLTIKDIGGNTFSDSCGIVIYSHYDR